MWGNDWYEVNWAAGEPNNYEESEEDCAVIQPTDEAWNDIQCEDQVRAVCRKPVPPMLHF